MKCSADVVTACDESDDGCGFCGSHCPYDVCPLHGVPFSQSPYAWDFYDGPDYEPEEEVP